MATHTAAEGYSYLVIARVTRASISFRSQQISKGSRNVLPASPEGAYRLKRESSHDEKHLSPRQTSMLPKVLGVIRNRDHPFCSNNLCTVLARKHRSLASFKSAGTRG